MVNENHKGGVYSAVPDFAITGRFEGLHALHGRFLLEDVAKRMDGRSASAVACGLHAGANLPAAPCEGETIS